MLFLLLDLLLTALMVMATVVRKNFVEENFTRENFAEENFAISFQNKHFAVLILRFVLRHLACAF